MCHCSHDPLLVWFCRRRWRRRSRCSLDTGFTPRASVSVRRSPRMGPAVPTTTSRWGCFLGQSSILDSRIPIPSLPRKASGHVLATLPSGDIGQKTAHVYTCPVLCSHQDGAKEAASDQPQGPGSFHLFLSLAPDSESPKRSEERRVGKECPV